MDILFDYDEVYEDIVSLKFNFDDLANRVVKEVLKYEKILFDIEVSITVVNNEEIQILNKKHRNKDYPTDVLSFPMYTSFGNFSSKDKVVLGDIVLSIEKAKEQSISYNHSLEREVGFLIAHSMLHLLGYDHLVEVEEKIMIKKQEDVLNNINLKR
ncbi:MAG: rRNA maturation RNase YbeY [Lachnospirales bacterium]